jgi:hypothetical protein
MLCFIVHRLRQHVEEMENTSLARTVLFESYEEHCAQQGLAPVNTASFGKLIRATFRSIQTRRLGVRGQSRYYYHGIGIRPTSSLAAAATVSSGMRNDVSYRYADTLVVLRCRESRRHTDTQTHRATVKLIDR